MAAVLLAELLLLEQELRQPRDRCERIVELMGDAGDELADGGELLTLDQLRFERLLVRDVLDHHDNTLFGRRPRNAGGVDADRAPQSLGTRHQRSGTVAAPRRREQLLERARLAQQRLAERRADDVFAAAC